MNNLVENAGILGLPGDIRMTLTLSLHIDRLGGGRAAFCRDGRSLFRWFDPWPAQGPSDAELMQFFVSPNFGPGRTLSLIANCEAILRDLRMPRRPSLLIDNFKARLVKYRNDGRVLALAIGEVEGSTLVSMSELVPEPDASLKDAVEYLAILAMTRWQSRPDAALDVPMKSIRRHAEGYFAIETITKTSTRELPIDEDLIAASNRVTAMLPKSARRHIFGEHADVLLNNAIGYFIPALDHLGQFRGPDERFDRHWYGRMLKRRVEVVCHERGFSSEQRAMILARTSGKSSRRGGKADDIFKNTPLQQSLIKAELETPHLALLYGDGVRQDTSAIARFVLSQPAAAIAHAADLKAL